jgi:hypothetical protein
MTEHLCQQPYKSSDGKSFRAGIRDVYIKEAIKNKEPFIAYYFEGNKVVIAINNKPKNILKNGEHIPMEKNFPGKPMDIVMYDYQVSDIWDLDRWNNRKLQ